MLRSVGIAHRDATAPQPERLVLPAVRPDLQARAMAAGLAEALVLPDCSRTELPTVLDSGSVQRLRGAMNVIALYSNHNAPTPHRPTNSDE
jgi:hypothetical protein